MVAAYHHIQLWIWNGKCADPVLQWMGAPNRPYVDSHRKAYCFMRCGYSVSTQPGQQFSIFKQQISMPTVYGLLLSKREREREKTVPKQHKQIKYSNETFQTRGKSDSFHFFENKNCFDCDRKYFTHFHLISMAKQLFVLVM